MLVAHMMEKWTEWVVAGHGWQRKIRKVLHMKHSELWTEPLPQMSVEGPHKPCRCHCRNVYYFLCIKMIMISTPIPAIEKQIGVGCHCNCTSDSELQMVPLGAKDQQTQ